jgi:hypothetical protein
VIAILIDPAAPWLDRTETRLILRALAASDARWDDWPLPEETLGEAMDRLDRFRCATSRARRWSSSGAAHPSLP